MARSVIKDLEIHFENQENCDVLFKVGGHTLGAHKFMLQVRNQILYNMVMAWKLGDEPIPLGDMDFDSFKALLRMNEMVGSLIEDLKKHFENQENCDVLFKVGGHTLGAHKFMLQVRNQVLYDMVASWNLGDEPILVEEMDFSSFKAFIRFIYTEEIFLSDENVFTFLFASKHFKMPLLEKLCANHIGNILNTENVCNLMNEAIDFKSAFLQELCKETFSKQTITVLKDKSFMEISQPALSALLEVEDTNVIEIELFGDVKLWMTERCQRLKLPVNGANMRYVIGDALNKIRFPTMNVQDFANSVTTISGLLTDTEIAQIFQMITVFDTTNINCPFSNEFRCQYNSYYTPFNDMAQLLKSQVLYNNVIHQYCDLKSMMNYIENISNNGLIKVTPLRIILQCCADLANSTGRTQTAGIENQTIRKEIQDDFRDWQDITNTKNLRKIMTKFLDMSSKLDKVCAWP